MQLRRPLRIVTVCALATSVPMASLGGAAVTRSRLGPMSLAWSFPSIAVDAQGDPHLLYPSKEDVLHHAWRKGGRWMDEVVDDRFASCSPQSIAVDIQGRIHIAYRIESNDIVDLEDLVLVHGVRDESGWSTTEVAPGSTTRCLALGLDGRPRILQKGTSGNLEVQYFDGETWVPLDTGIPGPKYGTDILTLAVDGEGNDHALYVRDGQLLYAEDASGGWQETAIAESPMLLGALALDEAGRPHVAVSHLGTGPDDNLLHVWHDGSDWQTEQVFPPRDSSVRMRTMGGILMHSPGHIFVTFTESKHLHNEWVHFPRVAHFDGVSWREVYTGGPEWLVNTSSAVGPDGSVHAVYGGLRVQHMKFTLPDLVAEWDGLEAGPAALGTRALGHLRIRNEGPGASGTARISFYLSDDGAFDGADEPVGTPRRIGRVPPGRERFVPCSLILPADAAGRRLLAVVDPDGRLDDIDRPNNTAAALLGE